MKTDLKSTLEAALKMDNPIDAGSLHALLCPACNEVSALRETWIEDYGNGHLMRACPKCECESAPDEWREQPIVLVRDGGNA